MTVRIKALIVCSVLFVALVGLAWRFALYTDVNDPKNMRIACWRLGLCSIDPQRAANVLIHTQNRDAMIQGKTHEDLAKMFGFLTPLDKALPYLQQCVADSPYAGHDGAFIRNGDLMVIFANGRATGTVLVKGCGTPIGR